MGNIYQKYRPSQFCEMKGQTGIVQALVSAIKTGRIGHAYLFTGPRGTGKTSLARIFAKRVNCLNPKDSEPCLECTSCKEIQTGISLNVIEIDAASYTGVDKIRELREEMSIPPIGSPYRIYIIDEVHMLTKQAFNALLKTLEEPPKHIIFILATTELHKVLPTIRSRCQEFEFSRIFSEAIVEKLDQIAKQENLSIQRDALMLLASLSEGGMRNAESLLSQVIPLKKETDFTREDIENIFGLGDFRMVSDFAFALFFKSSAESLELIDNLIEKGTDPKVFLKNLIHFFRQALHIHLGSKYIPHEYAPGTTYRTCIDEILKHADTKKILDTIDLLTIAHIKTTDSFLPQLPLEIAAVKITYQNTSLKNTTSKESPLSQKEKEFPLPQKTIKKELDKKITSPPIKEESRISDKKISTEKNARAKSSKNKEPKEDAPLKKNFISLEKIQPIWGDFLLETKKKGISFSLAFSNAIPLRMEEKTLVLSTPFSLHRDKINESKNRLTAEEILTKLAESPIVISCLTDEESGYIRGEEKNTSTQESSNETLSDALEVFSGSLVDEVS